MRILNRNFSYFNQSVSISSCGNFTLLGTIEGEIEKFNIQSGIHRGTYVDSALITRAHNGSVQGVKCDSSNSFLVSASLDGLIKVLFGFFLKKIHLILLFLVLGF